MTLADVLDVVRPGNGEQALAGHPASLPVSSIAYDSRRE